MQRILHSKRGLEVRSTRAEASKRIREMEALVSHTNHVFSISTNVLSQGVRYASDSSYNWQGAARVRRRMAFTEVRFPKPIPAVAADLLRQPRRPSKSPTRYQE